MKITMARNAAFGPGVYFQDVNPMDHAKTEILYKNWGGDGINIRKLMYVIKVKLPDTKVSCKDKGRHVWLCCEEVDLECCEHEFLAWPGTEGESHKVSHHIN